MIEPNKPISILRNTTLFLSKKFLYSNILKLNLYSLITIFILFGKNIALSTGSGLEILPATTTSCGTSIKSEKGYLDLPNYFPSVNDIRDTPYQAIHDMRIAQLAYRIPQAQAPEIIQKIIVNFNLIENGEQAEQILINLNEPNDSERSRPRNYDKGFIPFYGWDSGKWAYPFFHYENNHYSSGHVIMPYNEFPVFLIFPVTILKENDFSITTIFSRNSSQKYPSIKSTDSNFFQASNNLFSKVYGKHLENERLESNVPNSSFWGSKNHEVLNTQVRFHIKKPLDISKVTPIIWTPSPVLKNWFPGTPFSGDMVQGMNDNISLFKTQVAENVGNGDKVIWQDLTPIPDDFSKHFFLYQGVNNRLPFITNPRTMPNWQLIEETLKKAENNRQNLNSSPTLSSSAEPLQNVLEGLFSSE